MSDEYLAEWRPYKVTAEQLPKLQRKEKEAIDAFYLENYDYFIGYAKCELKDKPGLSKWLTYEDIAQDIYANLHEPHVVFTNVPLFKHTLDISLSYSSLGGYWNKRNFPQDVFKYGLSNFPFFNVQTTLDEPLKDDSTRTFKDLLPDADDPYTVWMKERERRRQELIELESNELLRTFLCDNYFKIWQEGRMKEEINRVIRKHATEILALLRRYGTPEHKLQGNIKTEADHRAEMVSKAAYLAWEREHLDELTPERRYQVKKTMAACARRAVKYAEARAERAAQAAERQARYAWEEEHLNELSVSERQRVYRRLWKQRKRAEKARASV